MDINVPTSTDSMKKTNGPRAWHTGRGERSNMHENWLCKHCDNYKGMEEIACYNGKKGLATRCGDPPLSKDFEKGKDYLLHYAYGRPNWCKAKVSF
jgi:hypothetical protein